MDPDQGDRPGGGVPPDSDRSYVDYTLPGMVLLGDQPQSPILDTTQDLNILGTASGGGPSLEGQPRPTTQQTTGRAASASSTQFATLGRISSPPPAPGGAESSTQRVAEEPSQSVEDVARSRQQQPVVAQSTTLRREMAREQVEQSTIGGSTSDMGNDAHASGSEAIAGTAEASGHYPRHYGRDEGRPAAFGGAQGGELGACAEHVASMRAMLQQPSAGGSPTARTLPFETPHPVDVSSSRENYEARRREATRRHAFEQLQMLREPHEMDEQLIDICVTYGVPAEDIALRVAPISAAEALEALRYNGSRFVELLPSATPGMALYTLRSEARARNAAVPTMHSAAPPVPAGTPSLPHQALAPDPRAYPHPTPGGAARDSSRRKGTTPSQTSRLQLQRQGLRC